MEVKEKVIAFVKPYGEADRRSIGGFIMFVEGPTVQFEFEQVGSFLDEWMIPNIPQFPGIMVWEGVCENSAMAQWDNEWEPRFNGKWRNPTAKELWELRAGGSLTKENTSAE